MKKSYISHLNKQVRKIDHALDALLPGAGERPARLHEAMRYAVFPGGKRVRPLLVLEACRAVGGDENKAMPAACAIELIHAYSLVHDDLPCMDDDDLRRGKPSCHKKFGEATALLAGDALLTLAFGALALPSPKNNREAGNRLKVLGMIAEAAGSRGMVGGQETDLAFQGKDPDAPTLEYINTHKTGALIAAATRSGAVLGGGSPRQVEALYRFGRSVGFLFQIVDDILDREGYANSIGPVEAKAEAQRHLSRAKKELILFRDKGLVLAAMAEEILERTC